MVFAFRFNDFYLVWFQWFRLFLAVILKIRFIRNRKRFSKCKTVVLFLRIVFLLQLTGLNPHPDDHTTRSTVFLLFACLFVLYNSLFSIDNYKIVLDSKGFVSLTSLVDRVINMQATRLELIFQLILV